MGFKIVLLGAPSEVHKRFVARAENLPWIVMDETSLGDACEVCSVFESAQPSVVVSLGGASTGTPPHLDASIQACERQNIPLVHVSSYEVFDVMAADEQLTEPDLASAGESPIAAQYQVLENSISALHRSIILRTSWVLDSGPSALLDQLVPVLLAGNKICVSDHHVGAPLGAQYIVDIVVAIIQQILSGADNWGVFHLHSGDHCSEAEFCDHLVRQLQKELECELIFPDVATQDDSSRFLTGNANLVGRRCTDDFGIQLPTWRRGFSRLLRDWLKANHIDSHISSAAPK